ncbi:MAG TPA: methyltransferase domain-containing protein [Anaerolineales bacterium]|nr:methyltransferase domain-containing protein [Anaerolineales bacterium]
MNRSAEEIEGILASFRAPDRSKYPELQGYSGDEMYKDFFGGGGLYLATQMVCTLRLHPGDILLDLGCGKGSSSIFLAKHYGVRVLALDLWTSVDFLKQKFSAQGLLDRITPIQMDVTQPLPFATNYFDSIFCMNSFNFYGGNIGFIEHLLKYLKPGGQLCIGSEVLTLEFTTEQITNPPPVYAFRLPPPNEHLDVFEGDFKKQHTPRWWFELFQSSGLVQVEHCQELEDAEVIYQELVRYEHEHHIDPFDVQICLDQMEWGRTHEPRKTLFVMTAQKS